VRIGRKKLHFPRSFKADSHRGARELYVANRVLVGARGQRAADRNAVLIGRASRRPHRNAGRVRVSSFCGRTEESVRRDKVSEELLDAPLATRTEHRIEIGRGVDAFRHERIHEFIATRLLSEELEEQVDEAVMRLRLLELGPVI
jgi:hypothetical protein